jgi:hypothetical protein
MNLYIFILLVMTLYELLIKINTKYIIHLISGSIGLIVVEPIEPWTGGFSFYMQSFLFPISLRPRIDF